MDWNFLSNFFILFLIVGLFFYVKRRLFKKITVYEYERTLQFREGKFVKTLQPGRYWINPSKSKVVAFDLRPKFVSITGQEVLSADGVSIKVSIAANYSISDPYLAYTKAEKYGEALHLILQLALREIIGSERIDDILEKRRDFGERLRDKTGKKLEEIGLSLVDVQIKDIMFPGSLKQIFAQVAKARQEGLAALERVRGETAALRKLANAAKLVESNPALMQLRMLQALGETRGNTLILNANGVDKTVVPVGKHSIDSE